MFGMASAILGLASLGQAQGVVTWQQVGGSLQVNPGLKGLVAQAHTTPAPGEGVGGVQSGFLAHTMFVNNAPFVVSPLADLSLPSGFPERLLDLDTIFADFDGSISYSVLASGAGTSANVSGSLLRIAGDDGVSGEAQVIVRASDGTFTTSDTFVVTTTPATGIASRSPSPRVVRELAVGLPRVFAAQVSGAGRGELGTASTADDAHSLAVNLLLPSAGTISVYIFDHLGTLVISMDNSVTESDLRRLRPSDDGRRILPVTWNLRASNGAGVAAGVYLWKIEMRTVDGQKLESVKRLGVKGAK